MQIADVLRGRGSNQIRVQDQHCVSVSPCGNNFTENSKTMHPNLHTKTHHHLNYRCFICALCFSLRDSISQPQLRLFAFDYTTHPSSQHVPLSTDSIYAGFSILLAQSYRPVQLTSTSTQPTTTESQSRKGHPRDSPVSWMSDQQKTVSEIRLLYKLAFFSWTPRQRTAICGFPSWVLMPGCCACNVSAHPAAFVNTGSKLLPLKLLQC